MIVINQLRSNTLRGSLWQLFKHTLFRTCSSFKHWELMMLCFVLPIRLCNCTFSNKHYKYFMLNSRNNGPCGAILVNGGDKQTPPTLNFFRWVLGGHVAISFSSVWLKSWSPVPVANLPLLDIYVYMIYVLYYTSYTWNIYYILLNRFNNCTFLVKVYYNDLFLESESSVVSIPAGSHHRLPSFINHSIQNRQGDGPFTTFHRNGRWVGWVFFMAWTNVGVNPKIGVVLPPKSSILIGFSLINHPFWGTTIFGNTHVDM